jgi:hypothetical protein
MREENRIKELENGGLRKTFGPKREEVIREWTELHNE